jgi:hypothetical protein
MTFSFKKTPIRLSLAVAAGLAAAVSSHAQSATATISAVAAGSSFDYTITLKNTGSVALNSFWYGWTIVGNNLPSDPSSAQNALGWANDLTANSIEWVNSSGTALAPGDSATFTFVSSNSPSAITKSPSGESVVYVGQIDFSQGVAGDSSPAFSPTLVNPPTPTVSITNPVNGATFTNPASVTIQASASVSSGTVTNVAFFTNGLLAGSAQNAPFNFTAGNLAVGSYSLTAVATAAGVSATSAVVSITVNPSAGPPTPTVSITNPVNGATFTAPASVTIQASAALSSGTVTNVAFFVGATALGSAQAAPFNFTATNLSAGGYALTAVATAAGVSATSAVVNISVISSGHVTNSVPVIIEQPQSQIVLTNVTVTFSVTTSNATSYQWQSNMVDLAGQTNGSLTLSNVVLSDSATYRVVVGNATNSVISSDAVLTVTTSTINPEEVAGMYAGLFLDTNNLSNETSGWFSATVTAKGVLNGQVKIAGASTTFTTKLQPNGLAAFEVPRHNKDSLVLTLQVYASDLETLTGTVADANKTFNAQLTAYRAGFSATHHATAYEGYYTWAMPAASGIAPAGNSYGTATVAPAGGVQLSVALGDGTTTTAAGSLSSNGVMPLYVSLYGGKGSLLAWLSFSNTPGVLSTNGAYWFKDPVALFKLDASGNPVAITVAASPYPDGFTVTNLPLFMASYVPNGTGINALDATEIAIQLSGADLTNSITNSIALNPSGIGGSSATTKINISDKTGLFNGSFLDPISGKTVTYKGAVLQPFQGGWGTFIGGGLSGAVVLEPASALLPSVAAGNVQVSPEFNQAGNVLIADQWNNRVIETTPSGRIVWSFGLGPLDFSTNSPISVNDAERVGDYTLMANPGDAPGVIPQTPNGSVDNRVLLVDPAGVIVWQYGQFGQTGNGSNLLNTPVQCTFVPDFNVLITDQGNNRIIKVNYNKEIVWQYPGSDANAADQLNAPNSAELLANGHVLIADQGNNRALEVTSADEIVQTFSAGGTVQTLAFASRLPNGDTLITDSGNARIVEVNAEDHVVWQYFTTNNAAMSPAGSMSIAAPQPTRAIRLADGNTLISDQLNNRVILINHAGKILADYGLPLPLDGDTFSGGSAGILIGENVGYGLYTTQTGLYSPYDAKIIGDYTGLTPPLKK